MLSRLLGFFSAAIVSAGIAWWVNPDAFERHAMTTVLGIRAAALSTSPSFEGRKAAARAAGLACLTRADATVDLCRAEAMRMLSPADKARIDSEQDAELAAFRERFNRKMNDVLGN